MSSGKNSKNANSSAMASVQRAARKLGVENPYLATLLNPEDAICQGIPDAYAGETHVCKIITQKNLFFVNNVSSGVVRPVIGEVLGSTMGGGSTQSCSSPDFIPISSLELGDLQFPEQVAEDLTNWYVPFTGNRIRRINVGASGLSIGGPINWANNGDNPQPSFAVESDVGSHLGIPIHEGDTVIIDATWANHGLGGTFTSYLISFYFGAIDTNGVYATHNFTSASITATSANNDVASLVEALGVPANTQYLTDFGISSITGVGGTLTGYLDMSNIACRLTRAVGVIDQLWATTKQGNSPSVVDALRACGAKYRVVAQSLWLQYRGAMTSNGQVDIGFIQDAGVPTIASSASSDRLPFVPKSYSGPLNKGAYAYYKPLSVSDVDFKSVTNAPLELPHINFVVTANDTPAANVTARICTILELQCANPVFGPRPSPVSPTLVWQAMQALSSLPTAMENDFHFRKIASWLRDKGMTVAKMAQLLAPINPMLGVAGKGAETFLSAFQ